MFTYDDEFKHIAKYMDIYELLLTNGPMHLDEIKKALIEAGVPETSARRNLTDFGYSDSELIWSDDNDRKYINHDISKYFIYELADALNVVIYGEALMQEIEDKYNVLNVIDRRYRTGKTLIITTNLHIDTMRNETSIDKKRIYDRVFAMCAPVQMKGVSKRKTSADNKIKLLRELNNRED